MPGMRPLALLGLFLLLATAGCGGSGGDEAATTTTAAPRPPVERYVSSDDLGDAWPLTVSNGTLACQGKGAVSFTTDEGIVYAVNANGVAWSQTNNLGWNDIDTIQGDDVIAGGKMKLGPLTAVGLRLCKTAPPATTTTG
jgi:hypothetical protein